MSVFLFSSRLLTIRPKIIQEDEGRLIIRNSLLQRAATLFFSLREAEILPRERLLILRKRSLLTRGKESRHDFDELSHLEYDYAGLTTSWNMLGEAEDEIDRFSISVLTHDNLRLPICTFRGEGCIDTGWLGTFMGDSFVDYAGTQEAESRLIAQRLAEIMDLPFGSPIVDVELNTCPACGQSVAPHLAKCMYCGAVMDDD